MSVKHSSFSYLPLLLLCLLFSFANTHAAMLANTFKMLQLRQGGGSPQIITSYDDDDDDEDSD